MASILDRYGIKEVADVTFYHIDKDTGIPDYPVLYLDTLKVSTIEQTGEEATANGGKGNAPLIIWDYGKEITVTLEDALFSAKSMAIMFGNGSVTPFETAEAADSVTEKSNVIMKTVQFTCNKEEYPTTWTNPAGREVAMINPKYYNEEGTLVATEENAETVFADEAYQGKKFFCTFDVRVSGSVIEISANSFPGTYYVTGDTYARSEISGDDEFFQFIIPKAKVQSENTITLEAEGDPSVFNMNLRVMRPADGVMMKLVKYEVLDEGSKKKTSSEIYHNHDLGNTGYKPPVEDEEENIEGNSLV